MGATRDVALSELPIRGISINTLAGEDSSHTLVGSDSGVMFINKWSSATTYTLPACAEGEGKWFWFYGAYAANILITSPTAATLYGPAALGVTCTGTGAIGISCMVIGDGTYYYALPMSGSWAIS